jgi:hypothetical protein
VRQKQLVETEGKSSKDTKNMTVGTIDSHIVKWLNRVTQAKRSKVNFSYIARSTLLALMPWLMVQPGVLRYHLLTCTCQPA